MNPVWKNAQRIAYDELRACETSLGIATGIHHFVDPWGIIIIVKYNGVYEVYEKDGTPLKRIFYRSEHPFAWSAGLFLYASEILSAQ